MHYTPTHGSWLNQADIEIGILARQCLGTRRIPDLETLRRETLTLSRRMNRLSRQNQLAVQGSPAQVSLQKQAIIEVGVHQTEQSVLTPGGTPVANRSVPVPQRRCRQLVGSRLPGQSRSLPATLLLGRLLSRAHLRSRSWVVPPDPAEASQNQLNFARNATRRSL